MEEFDGSIMQSCLLDAGSHISCSRRLVSSKSSAAPTSTKTYGNIDYASGGCFEMDSKAMERREG